MECGGCPWAACLAWADFASGWAEGICSGLKPFLKSHLLTPYNIHISGDMTKKTIFFTYVRHMIDKERSAEFEDWALFEITALLSASLCGLGISSFWGSLKNHYNTCSIFGTMWHKYEETVQCLSRLLVNIWWMNEWMNEWVSIGMEDLLTPMFSWLGGIWVGSLISWQVI